MSRHLTSCFRAWALLLGVLGLAAPATVIRAEVGVFGTTGTGGGSSPYVQTITDDPDPFGYWHRKSGPSAPVVVLNAEGAAAGDGRPAMLHDPIGGRTLVAWAMNTTAGFDVVVSRFENGAWTAPQTVAGSAADELDPVLALAPDGVVSIVYWVDDGASRRVELRSSWGDLTTWSAPDVVSALGEAACRPSAIVHDGILRVAYEVHDFGFGSSPRQVVLSRREGGSYVPEVVAITHHTGLVRPEVGTHAGRIWVAWIDTEDSGGAGEIAWTRLDASGAWESIRYEPFVSRGDREFHVMPGLRVKAVAP